MRQGISSLIIAGAVLAVALPSLAHHSRAMFDMAKNVTYQGVVKEYLWKNPHSHIVIAGKDEKDASNIETWDIEASNISLMVSMGWNEMTFKPGDSIRVVVHPSLDGSKDLLLFYVNKADGARLYQRHRYASESE
jgi:hypothetical protein